MNNLRNFWKPLLAFTICFTPALIHAGTITTDFTLDHTNDETGTFSDDQDFGTVSVTSWDGDGTSPGQVVMTVTATTDLYTGDLDNFGIQEFAFNTDLSLNVSQILVQTGDPLVDAGWTVSFDQNNDIAGYGVFTVKNSGAGNTRGNPIVITISGLDDDQAVLEHFALPSSGNAGNGNAYFVAHVAGLDEEFGPGSHWVGTIPDPGGPDLTGIVPEPASIFLFGLGTLGMGALARRRCQTEELELV